MKTLLSAIALLIFALNSSLIIAQEDGEEGELPVIPYFTASDPARKFNMPVPEGWRVTGEENHPEFVTEMTDATIHALAVEADETLSGIQEVVQDLFPDAETTPYFQNELNIDGLDWTVALFEKGDGNTLTGYGHPREGVVYVLLYDNREANDFFMLTVEHEDAENVQPDVNGVLGEIYDGIEQVETTSVELSNGIWTRTSYTLSDDTPLTSLHQARGRNTFVVVEEGDVELLDTVNKSFFSALFGFFVTPNSADFLYLGLAAIAVLMAIFIGAYILRQRSLQKDIALIKQLQAEEE